MRQELVESAQGYAKTVGNTAASTANKIPTEVFLVGALGSIALSLAFKLSGRDRDAEFVGHWAPTFLALGLFTKLLEKNK